MSLFFGSSFILPEDNERTASTAHENIVRACCSIDLVSSIKGKGSPQFRRFFSKQQTPSLDSEADIDNGIHTLLFYISLRGGVSNGVRQQRARGSDR